MASKNAYRRLAKTILGFSLLVGTLAWAQSPEQAPSSEEGARDRFFAVRFPAHVIDWVVNGTDGEKDHPAAIILRGLTGGLNSCSKL